MEARSQGSAVEARSQGSAVEARSQGSAVEARSQGSAVEARSQGSAVEARSQGSAVEAQSQGSVTVEATPEKNDVISNHNHTSSSGNKLPLSGMSSIYIVCQYVFSNKSSRQVMLFFGTYCITQFWYI